MAKRKKRKSAQKSVPKLSGSLGSFAELFDKSLLDTLPEASHSHDARDTGSAPQRQNKQSPDIAPIQPAGRAPQQRTPAPERVSPEELMRRAFEEHDDFDPAKKFLGEGVVVDNVEVTDVKEQDDEPPATTEDGERMRAEELLFYEQMSGEVERIDNTRTVALKRGFDPGLHWADDRELATLSAVDLYEPELTPAQRQLLRRSRRVSELPVLNVRMDRRALALTRIEAFVIESRARDARFCRIVTGKGRQSKGEPILKRALVDWCAHKGREHIVAWAPETDRSGHYGSIMLELQRNR